VSISSFEDLVRAAREQPEPQRLLFVFASAELPEDSTPEQRERYRAGQGGALTPLMSVDKSPGELESFAGLAEEARQFGKEWAIVFVASLSGRGGRAPTSGESDRALQGMVESIKAGSIASFLPFDRRGEPVLLG
jgi:hypothetical protein